MASLAAQDVPPASSYSRRSHRRPQPGAVVGRACAACPRGVFASRDLKRGDVILTVPMALALPLPVG